MADRNLLKIVNGWYKPSREAWDFHRSHARFRVLLCGVKSGKSCAGAYEFDRLVAGSPPRSLSWVVAPTYSHLEEAERELLRACEQTEGLLKDRKRAKGQREFVLAGDRVIQFKSADWPDNLRGPNIDGALWVDEAGFAKDEALMILRQRVAATQAGIIYTSSPWSRGWFWREILRSGIPPDMPYGSFESRTPDGGYFVGHWPTWQFPWVPRADIEAMRENMTKAEFDREVGAMFTIDANRAFHGVEECMSMEPPPKKRPEAPVLGLDLAKAQDWTALVIMDAKGRVLDVDRWNGVDWSMQRTRIKQRVRDWNNACVVVDKANVGSVIEEDLRDAGLNVHAVEMNDAAVKRDLIESLQLAFERKLITIPDPRARGAPSKAMQLYKELCWYEVAITARGYPTYGAPRKLTDDLTIAVALANWGRKRGLAGGASEAADFALSPDEWDKFLEEPDEDEEDLADDEIDDEDEDGDEEDRAAAKKKKKQKSTGEPSLRPVRPGIFRDVFRKRRSMVGFESMDRPFWGGR